MLAFWRKKGKKPYISIHVCALSGEVKSIWEKTSRQKKLISSYVTFTWNDSLSHVVIHLLLPFLTAAACILTEQCYIFCRSVSLNTNILNICRTTHEPGIFGIISLRVLKMQHHFRYLQGQGDKFQHSCFYKLTWQTVHFWCQHLLMVLDSVQSPLNY